jgi:hypothetical protein
MIGFSAFYDSYKSKLRCNNAVYTGRYAIVVYTPVAVRSGVAYVCTCRSMRGPPAMYYHSSRELTNCFAYQMTLKASS